MKEKRIKSDTFTTQDSKSVFTLEESDREKLLEKIDFKYDSYVSIATIEKYFVNFKLAN